MKKILPLLLGVVMLLSAVAHILYPEFYKAMIPSLIPEQLANISASISEFLVGIALLIPKYRKVGGLGFSILMLAFLPLHTWD